MLNLKCLGNVKYKKNICLLFKINYLRIYKYFLKYSKVILSDKILFLVIISVVYGFEIVIVVVLLVFFLLSFIEILIVKCFLRLSMFGLLLLFDLYVNKIVLFW